MKKKSGENFSGLSNRSCADFVFLWNRYKIIHGPDLVAAPVESYYFPIRQSANECSLNLNDPLGALGSSHFHAGVIFQLYPEYFFTIDWIHSKGAAALRQIYAIISRPCRYPAHFIGWKIVRASTFRR